MGLGQRPASIKFLIRDRARQFTESFDAIFTADGIGILPKPATGTLRRELFDRLLIVNEHHLRRVLTKYLTHHNTALAASLAWRQRPGLCR